MRGWVLFVALCLAPGLAKARAPEIVQRFGDGDAPRHLLIRSTADLSIFGQVIEAYLATRAGLAVTYQQWGSNDLYDDSVDGCHGGPDPADMVMSSGVHQMVKLVNDACARSYRSPETENLPAALRWRDELWGVTREPVVMVYNRALVPPSEVPRTRFDLLDLLRPSLSRYAGRVATYDIERSGLGYLFAFADSREAATFGGLLESFGRTDAIATCCSAELISGVADGTYLIAYNVIGSYAMERAFGDDRIGVVMPEDYTLVLSRAVMIPKTARHASEAQAFLDYLLSSAGQTELQRARLIMPLVNEEGAEGERISETALRPIGLSPTLLVALDRQKREQFIRRWHETFQGTRLPSAEPQ
ncbi:ABC transporter substrate-binding protein [Labrenzia suaedae]|uniref:ABC transporter substrate-binding protein n=2 Tax=Roseibium litorale TaxID=2803841 RepID=A0ABR9CK09_9HYPH|nr:ABC transporter substrate-binding protein [Roseibium litorale]